eukprot:SAG11_NODE_4873_length_1739_cov_1.279878_1_plen_101_part_00
MPYDLRNMSTVVLMVPCPATEAEHREVLSVHTRKLPLAPDVDLDGLAVLSSAAALSGAQIASLCREAAMLALREDMGVVQISMAHFEAAATRLTQNRQQA